MILCIDVSEYQPVALPWKGFGVDYVIIRGSIGIRADQYAIQHLAGAQANDYNVGWYHALLSGYSGANQAQAFDENTFQEESFLAPGVPRYWVDVESLGVNADLLSSFLAEWKRIRPTCPIGIYTSRYFWQEYPDGKTGIIGTGHSEFAAYPLWVADYRSGPPALPDIWQHAVMHQFRSKAGYLPGYADDLDVSEVFPGEPIMPAPYPVISFGSKIGIHSIQNENVVALVQKAAANGYHWPLVKKVNDPSPLIEVKKISPETITLCRYINPNGTWEGMQDVGSWSQDTRIKFATESIGLITGRTSASQFAATDYFGVINEPDPKTHYDALGLALIELIHEADRHHIRLAVPALPQGTPEWDDMQRLRNTGLFRLMRAGGHILDLHEGVYDDQAVDDGYGSGIPGAPFVAGAGSANFRHRYLYSLLEPDEMVSLVISEFYGGGGYHQSPAEHLKRFEWYDVRARAESYLLAFCGFTIDPDDHWRPLSNYDSFYLSSELEQYQQAQAGLPNAQPGDTSMDEAVRLQIVALATTARDNNQVIINLLPAPFLYQATVLQGVRVRDASGNPLIPDTALTIGTQVDVYAEHIMAGAFSDRAKINLNGNNIVMTNNGAPTLQKL